MDTTFHGSSSSASNFRLGEWFIPPPDCSWSKKPEPDRIKKQWEIFIKDDFGFIMENKDKNLSFNDKINVKLAGMANKVGKEFRCS